MPCIMGRGGLWSSGVGLGSAIPVSGSFLSDAPFPPPFPTPSPAPLSSFPCFLHLLAFPLLLLSLFLALLFLLLLHILPLGGGGGGCLDAYRFCVLIIVHLRDFFDA